MIASQPSNADLVAYVTIRSVNICMYYLITNNEVSHQSHVSIFSLLLYGFPLNLKVVNTCADSNEFSKIVASRDTRVINIIAREYFFTLSSQEE